MINYRKALELKSLGLSINSIAGLLGCKWDTVQRAFCRMENVWGDLEAVPPDLTSLQIADMVLSKTRFSVDDGFLQPDWEQEEEENSTETLLS